MLYGSNGKSNSGQYSWYLHSPKSLFSRHLIGIFRDALTSVCRRSAGDKYDGEWVHHQRHGNCIYTWSSGEVLASTRENIWRENSNRCLCAGAGVQLEQRGFVGMVC